MLSILKCAALIFFCSLSVSLTAQNKYAVLVGINDYYISADVKSGNSLKGCVNDANSIKSLLTNRFGFTTNNIYTLYNEEATKKRFVDLMYKVLQNCKPGDAVVFFYSGHGVWLTNHMLDQDLVKRGMSQAIVMSDLYAPGWDCLIKDETLKDIFNKFVDKKIAVTALFDCCYSGNMMMKPDGPYWNPVAFQKHPTSKDLQIGEIPYDPKVEKPTGCRFDSSGILLDTMDTDGDGVPDCKDWEIHSPQGNIVDSLGVVLDPDLYQFLDQPDSYYDPIKFGSDSLMLNETDKSFNLKDALAVSNKSSVRPSERKNSLFLSLAGAADNQKGLEITDLSNRRHGAFTAALIQVYNSNPPTLTAFELLKKISTILKQQFYPQTPAMHFDAARLHNNLIGVNPSEFSNKLKAASVVNSNRIVTIDKGLSDGVAKGNIFLDVASKQKIQITTVNDNSATGILKTDGQVKVGHTLELVDDYTTTEAIIKIYIPVAQFTPASFQLFFQQKIMPIVNSKNYGDYNYTDDVHGNTLIVWKDVNKFQQTKNPIGADLNKNMVYMLLPVPSFIADQLKQLVIKDQNIEIVDDSSKATYGLYLNYAKQRADTASKFVFYIHPIVKGEVYSGADIFSNLHADASTFDAKSIQSVAQQLYTQAKKLVRYRTQAWINTYPKR